MAPALTPTRARLERALTTVLYRVVWQGFPPDLVWYEPKGNLGADHVSEYEARAAEEAAADEAAAQEAAELAELEEEEALPPE